LKQLLLLREDEANLVLDKRDLHRGRGRHRQNSVNQTWIEGEQVY